jgi:hypothetical protein
MTECKDDAYFEGKAHNCDLAYGSFAPEELASIDREPGLL